MTNLAYQEFTEKSCKEIASEWPDEQKNTVATCYELLQKFAIENLSSEYVQVSITMRELGDAMGKIRGKETGPSLTRSWLQKLEGEGRIIRAGGSRIYVKIHE